jgi:PPOX class probable F420-dependent enzyme
MVELPEEVQQFLDEPHLAVLVTLMKNGSPQATPVWVDHDGSNVLINTVEGHQKERNLERDSRVALCVVDHSRAGRYVQIRGRAVEITGGDEALQHINKLSQKYSRRAYQGRDGEQRIKVVIEPQHVNYQAGRGRGEGQSSRWAGSP